MTDFLRRGKGNVLLADSHVEAVAPQFGRDPDNYDPIR
jgi:prepilin-type processing-associated H-X9-DG protein